MDKAGPMIGVTFVQFVAGVMLVAMAAIVVALTVLFIVALYKIARS